MTDVPDAAVQAAADALIRPAGFAEARSERDRRVAQGRAALSAATIEIDCPYTPCRDGYVEAWHDGSVIPDSCPVCRGSGRLHILRV